MRTLPDSQSTPEAAPAAADDFRAARRVLDIEAKAIGALARSLDHRFSAALDLLARVTGRVVVTGMGKSGHIARKIASTLASTGTPALYVHPGEASHGDLGMIAKDDAVIALSNSGETPELADLLAYTRRFSIPLIGVTGRAGGTLEEMADVALVLPEVPEGCPMGLAPTTSTTLMLALGDALAVALLERKGFTAQDFQRLHPGGRLGRKLIRVSDLMHVGEELPLVEPAMPMAEALLVMTHKSFGCVGIVDGTGRIIGIITDGDLRRHMSDDLLARTAAEVMTRRPKTIRPGALAAEAVTHMHSNKITNLFVVENGRPIGILHLHDCLRAGVV
ncbi:MAG: SIS domain-containing protein [Kiloniellales bacterium]